MLYRVCTVHTKEKAVMILSQTSLWGLGLSLGDTDTSSVTRSPLDQIRLDHSAVHTRNASGPSLSAIILQPPSLSAIDPLRASAQGF